MRLLVSVRNRREAEIVVDSGASIVDVKEPRNGSLGAADAAVRRELAEFLSSHQLLTSVALGELSAWRTNFPSDPCRGFHFAKIGTAGVDCCRDWQARWQQWAAQLGPETKPVAVAYADHQRCGAPSLERVLSAGIQLRFPAFLVDTFDKCAGSVFQQYSPDRLQQYLARARDAGMLTVLAGSICSQNLTTAIDVRADVIAIRGAACAGDRSEEIDRFRLSSFVRDFRRHARHHIAASSGQRD